MKIVIAVIIFSLIILIHEFGHFLLAKKNGICVLEFSLGLGPKLWGFQKGETFYCIKALPFGGECRMLGEDEDEQAENAFGKKPVWGRISVIAAGPIFNFILAFLLAVIVISIDGFDRSEVRKIIEVDGAAPLTEAGIEEGDVITKINGSTIHLSREIYMYLQLNNSKEELQVTYEHNGEKKETVVTPRKDQETGRYMIGITGFGIKEKGNPLEILQYSVYEVRYWIVTTFKSLGMLFSGQLGVKDLSGPVGIVDVIGETYESAREVSYKAVFLSMMNMAILLTANLGVMNLLPLPALDGGRLVFLLIEAITKRRVSTKIEAVVHFVGLMLLFGLMIFVMFNDVMRIFTG
ncbi:MAG: RIP metalloprotease RseP [Lachnospiraceae bacterium]|nr:RIP metalloprotease RseP [Lachnospiraceae bacterium]